MSSALGPWWGSGWGGRRGGGGDWFGGDDLWDPFDFGRSWNWDRRPTGAGGRGGDETTGGLIPTNVDWCETPEAHIIRADLPGMKKEEVKVQLEDENVLQISGERNEEREEGTDKWHRVERRSGGFLRRFRLPENANTHAINCRLEHGVLTVTIPKKETQPPTRNLRNIDVA